MAMLLVRVQPMLRYQGEDGPVSSDGIDQYEYRNFLCRKDGRCYGYLRPAGSRGQRVVVENYFPDRIVDGRAIGITVVFVVPGEQAREFLVVGFYRNSEIHAEALDRPEILGDDVNIRMASCDATCIPEDARTFSFVFPKVWGNGMYRSATPTLEETLNCYIDAWIEVNAALGEGDDQARAGVDIGEWVVLRTAERRERRISVNLREIMLTGPGDYRCACCNYVLPNDANEALRRSFEVHHRNPVAWLAKGEVRMVHPEELAVVCANCHRAIHATNNIEYIGDMDRFRLDILRLPPDR